MINHNRSRAMPMNQSCGGSGGVRPEMVAFKFVTVHGPDGSNEGVGRPEK